jgi:hypothetical protein
MMRILCTVLLFLLSILATNADRTCLCMALQEAGLGIEHHLLRGRPLAAFNSLIVSRVDLSSVLPQSSKYVSSAFESQAPLSSLTKSEEADIAMVCGGFPSSFPHHIFLEAQIGF